MRKKQYEMYKRLKEEDIPIMIDGDKTLTPKKIYKEKKRIKPTLSSQPDWNLLEKRLDKKLEKGMLKTMYTMNREMSPEKQLEEVKNKTDLGYNFMLAEKGLLDYLLAYE